MSTFSNGKPRQSRYLTGREFKVGDSCMVRINIPTKGPAHFRGVVTKTQPLTAQVTDDDPIWQGCEVSGKAIQKGKYPKVLERWGA